MGRGAWGGWRGERCLGLGRGVDGCCEGFLGTGQGAKIKGVGICVERDEIGRLKAQGRCLERFEYTITGLGLGWREDGQELELEHSRKGGRR